MQISTSLNQSGSGHLTHALASLRQAAQSWDQAEQSQTQADRFLSSAERDFQNAEFPARRASFDNGRKDSSFEGREIDRHFRSGDRNIDDGQYRLRHADQQLRQTGQNIDQGQNYLSQLEQEYRESGDERLASVQSAQRELLSSERSFGNVDNAWNSAHSDLRFTKSNIQRADFDIRQISWDRPGQDVSMYGSRVSNTIRTVQNDIRGAEWDMRRAGSEGNTGESHLDRAIAILEGL